MLKEQKDMSNEELNYVKECLKASFTEKEETILIKYCKYITKKVKDKENSISLLQYELNSLQDKTDEYGKLMLCGILFGAGICFFSSLDGSLETKDIITGVFIAVLSIISGELLYFKNKENQEKIYSDLDKENEKLLQLEAKQEKVLNYKQYKDEIKRFISEN